MKCAKCQAENMRKTGIYLEFCGMILCLYLVVFGNLLCKRGQDRSIGQESRITLLSIHDNEQSVFRDARVTMFLMFLPLALEDEKGLLQPVLLDRWEHSEDYTDWTLHLREDVKWHDGQPVTAQDVKFTLELITDQHILYENPFFEEITIIDTFTLTIRADKPFDPLPYSSWYGICPHHLLSDLDPARFHDWEFWSHPVGNGPYRFVRHVANTMVELEVNPDYYGEKPKIKRVEIKFGANPVTELMSGNVDAASNLPPHDIMRMAMAPDFNIYHEFRFNSATAVIWNHNCHFFQDPSVRRALTLAINRKELHRILNLPESTPIFDVPFHKSQFYRGELPLPMPYDPEQARGLLEEAGWNGKTSGSIRENNGEKFHFTMITTKEYEMAAIYIQDQLRRVGIRMEILTMETIHLLARAKSGDFEAGLARMNPVYYGEFNRTLYSPELESLLKSAIMVPTVDELAAALRELWPNYQAEIPMTFLYPQIQFNVVHKRIHGLESPHRAYPCKFMEHVWIDAEH